MAGQGTPPSRAGAAVDASSAITAAIAPAVAAAGLDLELVQVRSAGRQRFVRILVDAEGGVTLDAVAAASTAVSEALDASGVMGESPYTLDVGSPGVDRPLALRRHWRRNIGRLVRITTLDGRETTGRITGVDGPDDAQPPDTVVIDVSGRSTAVQASTIRRAVVQVEFGDAQFQEE